MIKIDKTLVTLERERERERESYTLVNKVLLSISKKYILNKKDSSIISA